MSGHFRNNPLRQLSEKSSRCVSKTQVVHHKYLQDKSPNKHTNTAGKRSESGLTQSLCLQVLLTFSFLPASLVLRLLSSSHCCLLLWGLTGWCRAFPTTHNGGGHWACPSCRLQLIMTVGALWGACVKHRTRDRICHLWCFLKIYYTISSFLKSN